METMKSHVISGGASVNNAMRERPILPFVVDDYGIYFRPGMKLEDIERAIIIESLRHYNMNRTKTAKVLGIGIRTLQRKIKQYRVSDPDLNLDR